jgi:CheY-like chemotaxis protein
MAEEKNAIRVMIVDDAEDFRTTMQFWLKSKGYVVDTASNGRQALELVKSYKPQIIFLDLRMPELDGVGCLRELRKFQPQIPVVIISAYVGDEELIEQASQYNISGIFSKDKDFNEALSMIETVLKTHRGLKRG